jgi:hypothetical protein
MHFIGLPCRSPIVYRQPLRTDHNGPTLQRRHNHRHSSSAPIPTSRVELGSHGTTIPVPPVVGLAGVVHDVGNFGAIPMGTESAVADGAAQATRIGPQFAWKPCNPKAHIVQLSRREVDRTTTWFGMIRTAEFVPTAEHALRHDAVVALLVPCVWEHALMHCISIQPCVAVVLHGSYDEGCMRC